jgi:hypothetical protein
MAETEWSGVVQSQTHKAALPLPTMMPVQRKPFIKRANNDQVSPSTRSGAAVSPLAPKVATEEPLAGKPPGATPSNSHSRAKQNDDSNRSEPSFRYPMKPVSDYMIESMK